MLIWICSYIFVIMSYTFYWFSVVVFFHLLRKLYIFCALTSRKESVKLARWKRTTLSFVRHKTVQFSLGKEYFDETQSTNEFCHKLQNLLTIYACFLWWFAVLFNKAYIFVVTVTIWSILKQHVHAKAVYLRNVNIFLVAGYLVFPHAKMAAVNATLNY